MDIFDKKINNLKVLKFIFKTNPFIFSVLIIFSVFLSVIPALKINLFSKIIDSISNFSSENEIRYLALLYFSVIIFQNLYPSIQEILDKIVHNRLTETISSDILNLILSKEYTYWENSDFLNSFDKLLEKPYDEFFFFYKNIMNLLIDILQLIFVIFMISKISIYLGILFLAILILLVLVSRIGGKREYKEDFKAQKSKRFANYLEEILTLKEYSEEREIFQTYNNILPKFLSESFLAFNIMLKSKKYWLLTSLKAGFFSTNLLIVIIILLILPLKNNSMSIGLYIAFANSIIVLIPTLSWSIPNNIKELSKTNEFFNNINEIILLTNDKDSGKYSVSDIYSIEFKNVTFKYPNSDKIILNNINLKLEKGKNYGIVGINGAGKSTVIKLILRLYENYSGEILLNQKNIKLYKKESIRKNISSVFQDFAEYGISIKENIILEKSYDDLLFKKVLKYTALTEKINSLTFGIDTVLGKKSRKSQDFSGGEWQRLAIARCMYNSKSLNIFDEPTSKIDAESEIKILNNLIKKNKNKISLIISHKLGSLKTLDEIIVIDNTKIVETGTFEELISKKGFFYKMYKKQKEWYNYE